MHLLGILQSDISNDRSSEYAITQAAYEDVEGFLEQSKIKHSWNAKLGILRTVIMTSLVHGRGSEWLSRWSFDLERDGLVKPLGIRSDINVKLKNLLGTYTGSVKVPDAALRPGLASHRLLPTISLEYGYTESGQLLIEDAKMLLEGTRGQIGVVILVKVQPLRPGETDVQSGYVQVWEYNQDTGRAVRRGRRLRLYPVPANHANQSIQFSWQDLLREHRDIKLSDAPNPPPLQLDELRALIHQSAEVHEARRIHQTSNGATV